MSGAPVCSIFAAVWRKREGPYSKRHQHTAYTRKQMGQYRSLIATGTWPALPGARGPGPNARGPGPGLGPGLVPRAYTSPQRAFGAPRLLYGPSRLRQTAANMEQTGAPDKTNSCQKYSHRGRIPRCEYFRQELTRVCLVRAPVCSIFAVVWRKREGPYSKRGAPNALWGLV